ncbi:MAG TPA: response regulator [Terriglobales bacterium]|nr:response regulator [Terriglobales bacterium]
MNLGKKHVLIADSDERALIALEHLLEDEGFDTTTAWSTSETVDLLEKKSFDLMLVADHPPELNCEAVLRKAKSEGRHVPLLVLENKPRHPFAEPYLMTLGARKIVHKWKAEEVKKAVTGTLNSSRGISVAGSEKVA